MKGSSVVSVGGGGEEVDNNIKGSRRGMKKMRGVSIMDFILRIIAAIATFSSAVAMATSHERLPFSTQFVHFRARFSDLPSFVFFVMGNAIVCGYLVLSSIQSIFHILRSTTALKTRILLLFLDTAAMGFLTAAASAAAAVVEIAHHGNPNTNWFPICRQYHSFCGRISASLIGSFISVAIFIILIIASSVSISGI